MAMSVGLQELGHNVSAGSFGRVYLVPNDGESRPAIPVEASLPSLTETEIAVVDLTNPQMGPSPAFASVGVGKNEYWVRCTESIMDTRPRIMDQCRDLFDRILVHGGQIVVFAAARGKATYVRGERLSNKVVKLDKTGIHLDNWSFSSCLSEENLKIVSDAGSEMIMSPYKSMPVIAKVLSRYLSGSFSATIAPGYLMRARDTRVTFESLATNKYGAAIAARLCLEGTQGAVLIVPNVRDKLGLIESLLAEALPEVSPELFPGLGGANWIHRPEYELPQIRVLEEQIEKIRLQTMETIESLRNEIIGERERHKDWYGLLTGTGRDLVEAVMATLRLLGFAQIVDVDTEVKDPSGMLREDVQIHDRSPVLIVDIKGVRGHPEDSEATQSEKHALMRAREWREKGTDVQPLTIVNHQRDLPPHGRDKLAYREEIIKNAAETSLGLMTTWDLWRIARNFEQWKWPKSSVMEIFYRTGRIEPVPEHYVEIGRIAKVWKDAFGVCLKARIALGSRLAVEVGDKYEEFDITSLHVGDEQVVPGDIGAKCGIMYLSAASTFRVDSRVFLCVIASA